MHSQEQQNDSVGALSIVVMTGTSMCMVAGSNPAEIDVALTVVELNSSPQTS